MASIDSGVDTENESSDSNFTSENCKASDEIKEAMSDIQPQPQSSTKTNVFSKELIRMENICQRNYMRVQYSTFDEEPILSGWYVTKTCVPTTATLSAIANHNVIYQPYPIRIRENDDNELRTHQEMYRKAKYRRKTHLRSHYLKVYSNGIEITRGLGEKKLRLAASLNDVEYVKTLLGDGVNPRSADDKLRTPLHIAACKGYEDVVAVLLEGGADPNQKDAVGNTALHIASYTNHFTVILQLLRATAANLHKFDESGCKILRIAQTRMRGFLNETNPMIKFSRTDVEEALRLFDVIFKHCHEKAEADLIRGFSNRLNLKKDESENTIQDVLSSLSELTLQKKV